MNLIEARPQHDTFGLDNAMLVAPGDPDRSILYQRIARRGRGQMPPLVTNVVDETAVQLIRDWIEAMTPQRKFVREWTMEDLLPHLDSIDTTPSTKAGRAAFREAGCHECHRVAGEGGSVGPDLTDVAARLGTREILTAILAPSEKIAPEYANVVVTAAGRSVTGRIEREDRDSVVLRPDPSSEPVMIQQSDIEERSLSPISNMPTGTLNTLEREQILDLLSYLAAARDMAEK
jgi:putative heme-binding domain-containing protein